MAAWKLKDKEWVESRKESWDKIERFVRYYSHDKSEFKRLSKYYLAGKEGSIKVDLLDKLWMHPEQTEEAWQALCEQSDVDQYIAARVDVLHYARIGFFRDVEGRLFRFLNEKTYQEGTYEYKGQEIRRSPWKPLGFFDEWRSTACFWLTSAGEPEPDDSVCMYSIDYWFSCLRYLPDEIFALDYEFKKILNNKQAGLKSRIFGVHYFLYLIAYFIEPRGLRGEDTKVRRFAEAMRSELESRVLPPAMKTLWEFIKTEDARVFNVVKDPDDLRKYYTVVLHGNEPIESPLAFIQNIHGCFFDLGFTDEELNQKNIECVELHNNMNETFRSLIGYTNDNSIPAYRYRINSSPVFINNAKDRIDMDVILFSHSEKCKWKDNSPVAMIVPRPNDNYNVHDSVRGFAWGMNYRLLRRTLNVNLGYNFKKYIKYDFPEPFRINHEADPFVDVDFTPLKSRDRALVLNRENEFPILDDASLPPLV